MAKKLKIKASKEPLVCIFILPPNFDPRIPQGFFWRGTEKDPGFKAAKAFHEAHTECCGGKCKCTCKEEREKKC